MRVRNMTVEEFIDKYYRADRLNRYEGRREVIIEDRKKDLEAHGEAYISRHDSNTREITILEK